MYHSLSSLNSFERIIPLHLKVSDEAVNSTVTGKNVKNNVKSANFTDATAEPSGREMGVDIGRVGAWATDFEKLLSDPVGLRTFTVGAR